jgi:diguanylate cyclase (GGDEF)-like protein
VTAAKHFRKNIEQYVMQLLEEKQQTSQRQSELEAVNARLQSLANTDGLTGAYNHRYFHEQLNSIGQTSRPCSLLMIDVDHFKSFNDSFGHPAGDAVLQAVAKTLQSVSAECNIVARYGGEEFALLMPGSDADAALAIGERIRREVESIHTQPRPFSVSVGVSTIMRSDDSGRALLEQADAALYAAKAAGRNRVMHHRHAIQPGRKENAETCKTQCAPSPTGCLRCESVPSSKVAGSSALLLGPQDADVSVTLIRALESAGFSYTRNGPLLIVSGVRDRLAEIETLFKNRLSPLTRNSVASAYVSSGLASPEQIMAALLVARPLSELIQNLEHEWIREALSDGWLFSVFHPIIDAKTGQLFAQEALLRARDPYTNKIIGAGQLITACAKLNLQHQLDQRARQAAIRGAAEHVQHPARIFINFLPNTIYDPEICLRTTMQAAEQCNVPMSRMIFEVVETEKIPDMDHLRRILGFYKSRGMGTAVDDMGAGFTGLDYISSLEPDFVKLDREFILTAEESADGRQKMDLIVSASQKIGARVIAEGIETEAQLDMCVGAGVDFVQGFLFAKPACPPLPVQFRDRRNQAA